MKKENDNNVTMEDIQQPDIAASVDLDACFQRIGYTDYTYARYPQCHPCPSSAGHCL